MAVPGTIPSAVRIVNLTPTLIRYQPEGLDGPCIEWPPAARDTSARVEIFNPYVAALDVGGTIFVDVTGQVSGRTFHLPDPEEGVYYIVSVMVARANKHRADLLFPGTKIFGARGQGDVYSTRHLVLASEAY